MKKLLPFLIIIIFKCSFLYSQIENTNKLPVVNLEIASVSGEDFIAPVWLKFYPGGTYDPDGKIVKFEMDLNSDGIYEISDSILQGGTFEYTEPGKYKATVRVTDDKGGITTLTKSFTIASANIIVPTIEEEQEPNVKNQNAIDNNYNIQSNSIRVSKNKPLTTSRMYKPDSIVKSGRWGTALNIRKTKSFDKFKTEYMEPGIKWTNGMFTSPDWAPTEMIYYHDGSDLNLTGFVSILDCIDYCGGQGDCGFSIVGDGNILWESGVVRHHDKPVEFQISLKGIEELRLIVNNGGDNIAEDWGVWMELKISKKSKKIKTKPNPDKNIIINGSFEEGFAPGTFKTLKAGDKIPGWSVTKATVDLSGPYLNPIDGNNCIDLNGTPGFGGIQQRFFTKKGKKYLLSFYLAGNPGGGPTIKKLLVSFGEQTEELEFDISGKTTNNMGWEYKELVFKAKQRATILKFESNQITGPTNWGPVIDNVKLVLYDKKKSKNKSEIKVITNKNKAQLFGFNYGVLGGVSYYFITDEDISRLTNYNPSSYNLNVEDKALGFHLGLMTQMRIWKILFRPEFVFNYNTIKYQVLDLNNSSIDKSVKESLMYFDIPILFGYKNNSFRIMAGPVGHLFITNKSELNDLINNSKEFENFTIGYQLGVGFDVSNLGIDFSFEGNFRNLGSGIILGGNKVYFSETPNRIFLSFSYYIK